MYSLTVEQTLAHLDAVVAEIEAAQPGTHEISPLSGCDVCHLELSYRMGDNRKPVLRVPSRQRLVYLALLFVGPELPRHIKDVRGWCKEKFSLVSRLTSNRQAAGTKMTG